MPLNAQHGKNLALADIHGDIPVGYHRPEGLGDVPYGLKPIALAVANYNRLMTGAVADGKIIGLDNRYALELVRAGDVLVEYDKLIDRQLERAAITSICGFGKICDGAACVLNV